MAKGKKSSRTAREKAGAAVSAVVDPPTGTRSEKGSSKVAGAKGKATKGKATKGKATKGKATKGTAARADAAKGKATKVKSSKTEAPTVTAARAATQVEPVAPAVEVPVAAGGVSPLELTSLLSVGEGFSLAAVDPASTPGFDGDKDAGTEAFAASVPALSELQERLFAHGRTGGTRSLLLVLQGMDTSGKGGIVRHVLGAVDPQGLRVTSFRAPTPQERAHDFLWRIRPHVPPPGFVGVFDRSHYEDVLAVRVRNLSPRSTWQRRFGSIQRFETALAARGVEVVKVMLHISGDEQRERLAERLDRPDKFWKYRPGDVDDRALWNGYQEAYADTLVRTSTTGAPWYVVPANAKWYARWAVQQLLLHHLGGLGLGWPAADFDVDAEKARLAAT